MFGYSVSSALVVNHGTAQKGCYEGYRLFIKDECICVYKFIKTLNGNYVLFPITAMVLVCLAFQVHKDIILLKQFYNA